ncbi:unnamed protein product [Echinostoma caproni]|uniref:ABC transporter domain-containing protein n=1 Tax=Echinostoma caproni TaxID=27848 RepID=A0A3P8JUZ9_9TREM|nr:unnamed protein product [Echinostoma caproni]
MIAIAHSSFTVQVDQEGNWECGPDSPPPPDWPAPCCEVRFNRASILYTLPGPEKDNTSVETPNHFLGSDEPALRSVDLILSGTRNSRRIGIVGRTGAGKSSLASSIFRLNEAIILEEDRATLSGSLANLGPEPVLFAGTLRFNLDPFGFEPEERLWAALEASHLASWVRSDGIGLDYECGEGGCNLSAGQRQLVCLARVCLSSGGRVRLLILDEATASMDPVTNNLVMQTVVGDLFRDATVIIIAHRLDTVLDTDLIVVMDRGRVVETGRPDVLLADPQSRFSAMYRAGH